MASYVQGEKGSYIKELMDKSDDEWRNGNRVYSIELLEKAWDELPENNKEAYSESYYIVKDLLITGLEMNNLLILNKWVDKIFLCDLRRFDTGEREYLAGKVAYVNENYNLAKEHFLIANQKSEGRVFDSKDMKYIKLMKS